jgi:hypothetical protein
MSQVHEVVQLVGGHVAATQDLSQQRVVLGFA